VVINDCVLEIVDNRFNIHFCPINSIEEELNNMKHNYFVNLSEVASGFLFKKKKKKKKIEQFKL